MKVINLMTYEEFLSNTKGYKNMGINNYYRYCHNMDSIYKALVKYHKENNKGINFDRDEITKYCYKTYRTDTTKMPF
jgi:hypothetical protein